MFEPLDTFEGYVVAVISREDDVEIKLVVSREKYKYNEEQIKALTEFKNDFTNHLYIMLK